MNEYIISENNGIKYLQFKKLLAMGIKHGFYIGSVLNFRTLDNKHREYPENFKHYKTFAAALNLDYTKIIKANQNHTANFLVVNKKELVDKPDLNLPYLDDVDALITDNPELVLATTAADCILIYIYDPVKKVIANVHSGWRGTLNNIIASTIENMEKVYNSNPHDLYCFINPAICVNHFEVDDDVYQMFKEKFPDSKYYFKKEPKWHIDLTSILISEILATGVLKENIITTGICNYENTEIHSYRRDKENFKLTAAYITLKED